jgi:hypothetical protein
MAPKSNRQSLEGLPSVTSARGAEIVGVGYEGFRSYLKRGLLGRTCMLPGFHRPGAASFDPPTPRAGWKRFDFADLCLMRIAKLLMEAGFSFADANAIVSQDNLWRRIAHDREPIDRYLLVWPPYGDFMLFEPDGMHHLPKRLKEANATGLVVTLINLGDVERHVAGRLVEAR